MSNSFTPPVPFTVIGGFLGAGKTTLLNYLLTEPSGVRYAILVNDFGELNIDESLIASHDGQTIALTNGCVCCSIANTFIETMINLVNRIDEFDQIVVEASGVSEPERIMDIARLDPELNPSGIVVLVDAAEVRNRAVDRYVGSVVCEQLRTAELLVVNKTDLVSEEELAALEAWLDELAPSALRLKTSGGKVPPALIFGNTNPFSKNTPTPEKGHPHDHPDHAPLPFRSIALQSDGTLEQEAFEHWHKSLPPAVIRGKGILHFRNNPEYVWVWQKVGQRSTLKQMPTVGQNLDAKALLIGTMEMPLTRDLGLPKGLEEMR
jgi:G3E family GTPase